MGLTEIQDGGELGESVSEESREVGRGPVLQDRNDHVYTYGSYSF